MNRRMSNALEHLNSLLAETGRQYSIIEQGDQYVLVDPNGGKYEPTGADAMVRRLVGIRVALEGRTK